MPASLVLRNLSDISGHFFVPGYQRGYRWTDEVTFLLDDLLENAGRPYCLQPVVVKLLHEAPREADHLYELIDGQQRFTTLLLIALCIEQLRPDLRSPLRYDITYKTRQDSCWFIQSLKISDIPDNPRNLDELHLSDAFRRIHNWFEAHSKDGLECIYSMLKSQTAGATLIWYEIGDEERPEDLFIRLNIGKIGLTNAELVKALLMRSLSPSERTKLASEWDDIEHSLRDPAFWAFVTNRHPNSVDTRIELLLDLVSQKRPGERERLFTFFYFQKLLKSKTTDCIWREIKINFQILRGWYADRELFHKIGYLISQGSSVVDLLRQSMNTSKSEFMKTVNRRISDTLPDNFDDLTYTENYSEIKRLLTLYNVISTLTCGDDGARFPFHRHKNTAQWSLEHIHAQNSEQLNTQEKWRDWLESHRDSLYALTIHDMRLTAPKDTPDPEAFAQERLEKANAIVSAIDNALIGANLTRNLFADLSSRVVSFFEPGNADYLHRLPNIALISVADNAALNNSTFDVKRRKVLDLDRNGAYIPICTRRVFLKYFSPASSVANVHFWSEDDRKAYRTDILTVLMPYLPLPMLMRIIEDATDHQSDLFKAALRQLKKAPKESVTD